MFMMGSFVCAPHVLRFRFSTIINRALRNLPPFTKTPLSIHLFTLPLPPPPLNPVLFLPFCPPLLLPPPPNTAHLCEFRYDQTAGLCPAWHSLHICVENPQSLSQCGRCRCLVRNSAASATDLVSGTNKGQCVEFTHGRAGTVNPFSWPSHFIRITRQ